MAITILNKIEERDEIGKVSFDIDLWINENGDKTAVNIEYTLTSEIIDIVSEYISEMQNTIFKEVSEIIKSSDKSYNLTNESDITEMMSVIIAEKGKEKFEKLITSNESMKKIEKLFTNNDELNEIRAETTALILESVNSPDEIKEKIINDWESRLTSTFINHSIEKINKMGL